jgi:hypothetical protein
LLSVWHFLKKLENPHQSLSPWLSQSLHAYQVNFRAQSSVQIITKTLKTKLKQINTFVVLFDYVVLNGVFMLCYFLSYSCTESYVCWLREVQSSEISKASVTLVHKIPNVLLCM